MKLIACVLPDGSIKELIAVPDSGIIVMKAAAPAMQICEIVDHGIEGESVEPDQLLAIREKYRVELADDKGRLVTR